MLAATLLAACGDDAASGAASTGASTEPTFAVESPGPHPVGRATVVVVDAARGRTLTVEVWYPADEGARSAADQGHPIEDFATSPEERAELAALVAAAPDPGTSRVAHAAVGAAPAGGATFPWVAFSHCFDGVRFSVFSIAERLASHGIAVVAPDHAGGTLFDALAGEPGPLDAAFLETRAEDVRFVIDRALDPGAAELPEALRGRLDPAALGVFGHSFGGVTAGRVLSLDPRPRAGLALAVPMENPLLPGVVVADLHVPLLFLMATEDNSITTIGNDFIGQNFETANPPVWKVDVADAGHWSVTDICGIVSGFDAGCNELDVRQTTREEFTYLDPEIARAVGAAYVTAFFRATLTGDAEAAAYLGESRPAGVATVTAR